MSKLLPTLGRIGNILLQVAMFALQGYVASANGGKPNVLNLLIAAAQVYHADQALKAAPPK